ncbi:MAG: hypothetical protein KGJ41_11915 [Rhodospirillales bacterium]|nr:hypothetical protein [Rhodospirillales bacterium]MDE2199716.1 hypothetical protein [Rhodospirillales bacterium]
MTLLGAGVLAIWNDIAPGEDAEFAAWHVREHIPERISVPGFLRARRYGAIEGSPAYFNFYETVSPAVLKSPAYLARLNDPTPWTRRVIAQFRNTSRTVCDVALSLGAGEGGAIETIRLESAIADPAGYQGAMEAGVLRKLLAAPGITAAHLLRGRPADSATGTAETALRQGRDEVADWILLFEAIDAASLRQAREGAASDAALMQAGTRPGSRRGIYALQLSLAAGGAT